MGEEPVREAVLRHLEQVVASPVLSHAGRQAEILAALVRAALDGRVPTGRELTREIYGRDDEGFLQAFKQAVHNLRRSLELYYAGCRDGSVRFELPERGYGLVIHMDEANATGDLARGRQRRLKRVGLASALATAATLLGLFTFGVFSGSDGLPTRVEVREGLPVVLDARGNEIERWTRIVMEDVDLEGAWQRHEDWRKEWTASAAVAAAVLEPTAEREYPRVVVAKFPRDEPGKGHLVLLHGETRVELDRLPLPHLAPREALSSLHFGERELPAHFHIAGFGVHDLDGDGRAQEILLGLTYQSLYPTQHIVVEARDRFVVRRNYWTDGNTEAALVRDLDRDGRPEVILRGTNNDFQQATLAIIRLDEPAGRTPVKGRRTVFREIEHLPQNGLVILFPRTALSLEPTYQTVRTWVLSPLTDPFVVTVHDVAPVHGVPERLQGRLEFDLSPDRDEFLVTFLDSDFYLAHMKKLIREGTVRDEWHIMENDTLEEYERYLAGRLTYWNGSEPEPQWRRLTPEALRRVLGANVSGWHAG